MDKPIPEAVLKAQKAQKVQKILDAARHDALCVAYGQGLLTYDQLTAAQQQGQAVAAYTTGHCPEKRKPGGCPHHNLHCGFPKCDQRPVEAAQEGE